MDVKNAHLVQLTDFGGNEHPAWSPDGKQIAFVSLSHNRGGKRDGLYIMNADGERLRRVPNANRGLIGKGCAWSPDGKQIAFSVYIPNTQREHLCVIDVDGKNFRQLTRGGPIPILVNKEPAFRFYFDLRFRRLVLPPGLPMASGLPMFFRIQYSGKPLTSIS